MSTTIAFSRQQGNNGALRVGLAQATADQTQQQIEEAAALVGRLAEEMAAVAEQVDVALQTAQQAKAIAEEAMQMIEAGGGGGGGGGDLGDLGWQIVP